MTKRDEVRQALVDEGLSVKDAAKKLGVSQGLIYQHRTKLGEEGVDVPKGKAGRPKATEQSSNGSHPTPAPEMTVEQTVAKELDETHERATKVAEQIEALKTEQEALKLREGVLAKAQEVLKPKAVA